MAPFLEDRKAEPAADLDIIDIRSDQASLELTDAIKKGLDVPEGEQKTLPTLLLYDEVGLKLFEKITYLDEYYLTGEEIEVLEQNATDIASKIPENSIIVELGSGNLRKIKLLLDALETKARKVNYYALDLDRKELERTLAQVAPLLGRYVKCSGLHGTYDDGLRWLQLAKHHARPKVVLSMGSSIGNFTRHEAADFLSGFLKVLGPDGSMIIGVDACQDSSKVSAAYDDALGVTSQFTLNGLRHANRLLARDVFSLDQWRHVAKYDVAQGKHEAFVTPTIDLQVLDLPLRKGELIKIEESDKYNHEQIEQLWQRSGAVQVASWHNAKHDYGLHMIARRTTMHASKPEQYAAHPVPSYAEWQALWQSWDIVTRQMIPEEELRAKPIKLRNACIFYLGHIPTFLDMKIVQATGATATEPSYFHSIFERGIDPDVDNPEHCHAHSEIPEEWPPLTEILDYQEKVRERVKHMYDSGAAYENLWTGRVLWLGFEHEAMHLETLLYMLLQSDKTRAPSAVQRPDFEAGAKKDESLRMPLAWHTVPEQEITLGLDDQDTRDGPLRYFGWDVEKPERKVKVHAFEAAARPITNLEYANFLFTEKIHGIPKSWGDAAQKQDAAGFDSLDAFVSSKTIKTVFGELPLKFALDWPVSASYDELAKCAAYMGGRIPTLEEAKSIYEYATSLKQWDCSPSLQKTIPAVNGHLSNDGVQISPPDSRPAETTSSNQSPLPSTTYVDLSSANVGLRSWTPVSVSGSADTLAGHAEMGGLWEWTSSPLEKQKGFEPMELYPAYSADFYDGKHNVVLGGSWATHPRLAGRKSFVNWYQRNYPYVWAGARVVKDVA